MAKFDLRKLNTKERQNLLNLLWTSVESLRTKNDIKDFFKDLLSESEAIMLARRILIARELLREKTYQEIMKEFGVGNSTVASVHHWLESGFGGYEKVLKNFDKIIK